MKHFLFRKLIASLLQGLCLTPGRRLKPTIEKLNRCTPVSNPPDAVLKALAELVQRQGWSNSLQDLASAIEAVTDDQQRFRKNTDLLLKAILDRLANSGEWKLMEMCSRHELKYVVNTSLSCSHRWDHHTDRRNPHSDTMEWSLPIKCSAGAPVNQMTQEDLQEQIVRLNSETTDVECKVCHEQVQLNVFLTVPHACDPDFLTLVCNKPVSLKQRKVKLQFSRSWYCIKAVTHWQEERKMAAVSREKQDGSWWWHGIVKSQAPEHKYTEAQLESSLHFQEVVVLFAVRMGSIEENCGEEVSQEGSDMSLAKDKVVQGNLEEATTEVLDGCVRIEETVSTGEESLCFISSTPKSHIQIYTSSNR